MNYQEILHFAMALSVDDRERLISSLESGLASIESPSTRLSRLLEKQVPCPHCGCFHYYRFGKDKGAHRFMCKDCHRTFTEYTGTWQEGLRKKNLVKPYMSLMTEQKSLDTISGTLHINKSTAFKWRHKILGSLKQDEGKSFSGITESDETFFDKSEKGCRHLKRKPHKRGGSGHARGISKEKATVIVTADRQNDLNMTFCGYGRLTKKEIAESLVSPLPKGTVLCSDGHVSYKGYAKDNGLECVTLRGDLGQHVKRRFFHIQHVNSLHSRLKKWIAWNFCGVATKYLQNYLNWFKTLQTKLKGTKDQAKRMLELSMLENCMGFATL